MSDTIVLNKGLNLPISGKAELRLVKTVMSGTVAIKPADFKGMLPRLLVREGSRVLCGSPVLSDKNHPEILVTSPVSGTVTQIVRGEKRKLLSVVISADEKPEYVDFGAHDQIDSLSAEEIRNLILSSGLWPLIIQRPYGVIANPEDKPKAIFVSAFDTAPLAPDTEFVYGGEIKAIQAALTALGKLTDGGIHVGLDASKEDSAFLKLKGVTFHSFRGKHPAGNVGVQISHVCPITKDTKVWTVTLGGLAIIGRLLLTGRYNAFRKIAVCGPAAIQPSYLEVLPGTPVKELIPFYGTAEDPVRIIDGDALSGTALDKDGFLGYACRMVTVIREGLDKELLGWARPFRFNQYSIDHTYFNWCLGWLDPKRKYDMDTNLHGGPRAFVMSDAYYAKVLPMDIYPLYLVKACLAGDIDKMEKFGIYEVLPEDLALCEYIDPSKNYIQDIIAKGIDLMLKEMA